MANGQRRIVLARFGTRAQERELACRGKQPGGDDDVPALVNASEQGNEPLAVVEAMKMENVLRAEKDGTVSKVNAKKGDSLAVDAVILEFA